MKASNANQYAGHQLQLARLAKALGHPARIAILEHLARVNACVCGDIVEELPLAQATVSQHLRELKEVGLIKGTVEGTSVCYCIDEENWKAIKDQLNKFFRELDKACVNCC